jgi:hypothetical protein
MQGKTGARVKDRRNTQNDNAIAGCNCGPLWEGWTKSKLPHALGLMVAAQNQRRNQTRNASDMRCLLGIWLNNDINLIVLENRPPSWGNGQKMLVDCFFATTCSESHIGIVKFLRTFATQFFGSH